MSCSSENFVNVVKRYMYIAKRHEIEPYLQHIGAYFGVLGMSYIHEKGFAYRDLKSRKVLLTSTQTAKICGTSTARKMDHTTQATMAGTYPWMAPEVHGNLSTRFVTLSSLTR